MPALNFQAHQGTRGLERIADEWARLTESIPGVRFNQLPRWYRAYLGSGRCDPATIWFVTAHNASQKLLGVFPLQLHGRRVGWLGARALGTIDDNELQLSDFTFAQTAGNASLVYELIGWLRSQRILRWDQLRIVKIAADSAFAFAARARLPSMTLAETYDRSAYFDTSGTYEQATRALNAKFRSNLRRRIRLAESKAPLRFQCYRRPEEIQEGLRVFLEVEASGWKGSGGTSSAIECRPDMLAFYSLLTREFGPRNECVINVLWHGEQPVAGQFGLRIGRTLYILKVGYSEEHALFAPGIVLSAMAIRHASEDPDIDVLSLVNDPPWAASFKPLAIEVHLYRSPNWTAHGLLTHLGLLIRQHWKRVVRSPGNLGEVMRARTFLCTLILFSPSGVLAETTFKLAGAGQYQYNTNVFDLQPGAPVPGTLDYRQRSDQYYRYAGELDLDHIWRAQEWYFNLNGAAVRYNRFGQLSHNEYQLGGGWKWRLGPRLSGALDVQRLRTMVPFAQLAVQQAQLSTSTDQSETARIAYLLSRHWSIEASGFTHTVSEPLRSAPDLVLVESQGAATFKFVNAAGFSWGLGPSYLHGNYSHTNGTLNPAYQQRNATVFASYASSGRSSINASLGYSSRDSAARADTASAIVGHLALAHELTGKTSLTLTLDRNISSYLSTAGSEVDSSASAGLNWRATRRITVSAAYSWTHSDFPAQANGAHVDRVDHQQSTIFTISYRPQEWLLIKPFASLQSRVSTVPTNDFSSNVYGIQLVLQKQSY